MKFLYGAFIAAVYAFLLAPILFVVISSFGGDSILTFPPTELTLHWYSQISQPLLDSLWISLIAASFTVVISVFLGTGIALAISRGNRTYGETLKLVSIAPLAVPSLAIGIALYHCAMLFWDFTGVQFAGTITGVIIGHVVIALPYVVRGVTAGHEHFDRAIEEAALNLGASRWYALRRITLPILMPGILSGALLAFLVSFDEVPISLFMGGFEGSTTLPVKILAVIEYSLKPDILAISSILILASVLLVLFLERVIGLEKFFGGGRAS
jgi:putative spermidine/putrescine transport system permease protein